MRRSTTLAGALVLAALVLVGTSSIVSAGHATLHLRPFLLSVEQMPTGWTAQHSTDAVGTGCPKPKGIKVTQDVTASFAGGGADVVEQLKTYSVAVDKAYSRVLRSLNACQHEKVREGTKSVNASVGAMSLPQYGNKSEAFNATWTDKGKSANIYEVAVRSGNIVVTVAERGSGGLSQFEAVTSLAMSKLPFGGKAPIVQATTTTVPRTTTTTSPPATTTTRPPPPATTTTIRPPPPVTAPPVTTPTLTQQQQSAVASAKEYLDTEAFSQQGLIDQLDSPDGSGYSVNDATVAVDSLTVNWNTEAVQAAKEYLQTQPFSCSDLIQQLDSPDGSQFTVAQATYGATQAGDC